MTGAGQALGGDDQLIPVEGRLGEFGEDLATDKDDHAVTDDEVGELIAAQQQGGAVIPGYAGKRLK